MLFETLCIFTQFLLMSFAADTNQTSPVKQKQSISIYYESLCPDSKKFFEDNFYKAYVSLNLNEAIDLKLNSYGNANTSTGTNGTYNFTCEHGLDECHKNMMHACVIRNVQNISVVLNFVNCSLVESILNISKQPIEECAKKAGIDMNAINSCTSILPPAVNSQAAIFLKGMGDELKQLGNNVTIPTVVFNDNYNETLSQRAVLNFTNTLCEIGATNNLTYEFCKNVPDSAAIPAVSVLPIVIVTFLLTKMYQ